MSITGDIYNIDQSLTGEGISDLELNTLLVDKTFQNVDADYFKNITSPIQDQFNAIADIVDNNASLDFAFLNQNNIFTGSLNKFTSIQGNINNASLISNSPAYLLGGITSNIQQQINDLQPTGNPINGQSATISIGTTTTLPAGSNASVINVGTNLDGLFNFGIPRGIQGETPTLEIGSVTTGSTANVTIDNSILTNPKLNFTLVNGTNGITPTFSINSVVDNLPSGSTPTITLDDDPTIANNKIFKFGLVRGVDGTDGITPTFSINSVVDNLPSGSTPTITLTDDSNIANNKIFKFGLVKGVNRTDGITPTFSIGSVSSVPYGGTASVTIDNTIPINPALSFVLITGEKGNPGEPGKDGDSSAAAAAAVASATSAGLSAGFATASASSAAAAAASASAAAGTNGVLSTRVEVLEQKTTGLSYNALTKSNFAEDLTIGINSVILSSSGTNYFVKTIQTSQNLISTGLNIYNNVDTGTIKASIDNVGNLNVKNIIATGSNISLGNGISGSTTTLEGETISIGENSLANIIKIGNDFSTTYLYGNINGFIKQETTGTRYIPAMPFTIW